MMSGIFTKRGVFSLRSVVTTAGRSTSMTSSPASTSRVTFRVLPFSSTAEAKGAWGRAHSAAPALAHLQQEACRHERLHRIGGLDEHRPVRAHGEGGAQLLLHLGGAGGHGDSFRLSPLSPGAPGFLRGG